MARNAHTCTCTCTCTCICKLHSNFKVSKLWQIELLFGTFKGQPPPAEIITVLNIWKVI